ncbi:MAG TPA: hypothetical protein VHG93_20275, partial [Longimicrobium sp.]|nr:hypothetical protein [Longimicrobium sp.]
MKMQRRVVAALAMVALAACGPSGGPSAGGGNARTISEEEIRESRTNNLFDTVQRLRPSWLAPKYQGATRGYPTIFIGSQRYGEIDYLRTVEVANVREVHYFDPIAASSRFGRNVPFGVIQIILDVGG